MIGVVAALSVACLFLVLLYIDAKGKVGQESIRYIDTSGVIRNPPSFIETWRNKTINFKFGKDTISIPHLPVIENVETISKIAGSVKMLMTGQELETENPILIKKNQALYLAHYFHIVDCLYRLSKPFNNRWFFKYRFYKKAYNDSEFVFGICEQVFDYWQNMGKLFGVLSKGATPRMMYGETLSSTRLNWGKDGKRLINPRFDFIPKSNKRKATETN